MKNVLMASSAIVGAAVLAASPAAAQELTLSGFQDFVASAGDADFDDSDRGFGFSTNTEVHVNGSIMADNGITFGFRVEFEADSAASTGVDENSISAAGSFGKLEFGNNDGAEDAFMVNGSFTGTQFGGVGNPTSSFLDKAYEGEARTTADIAIDSGDGTKITYTTPNFSGFSAGVSYTPDTSDGNDGNSFNDADDDGIHDHIGAGVGYDGEFNGVGLKLGLVAGFGSADAEPEDDVFGVGGGIQVSVSGFTVALGAGVDEGNDDAGGWGIDAGIGYSAGPWGFSVNAVMSEDDATDDELLAGSANVDYNLAPGVTVFLTGFAGEEDLGNGDNNDIVAVTSGLRLAF